MNAILQLREIHCWARCKVHPEVNQLVGERQLLRRERDLTLISAVKLTYDQRTTYQLDTRVKDVGQFNSVADMVAGAHAANRI